MNLYELNEVQIDDNINICYNDCNDILYNSIDLIPYVEKKPIEMIAANITMFSEFITDYSTREKVIPYTYFSTFLFLENFLNASAFFFNRGSLGSFDLKITASINLCYIYILRLYRRVSKNFNLYSFLYLLASAMYYKDVVLLKNFLIDKIRKISFKKHKRLLSMLRYAFRLIGSMMIKNQSIIGFKMFLVGKIGMAGSTKKKKWCFRIGRLGLATKKNRLKFETFQLWTRTGCLGVKLYLAF